MKKIVSNLSELLKAVANQKKISNIDHLSVIVRLKNNKLDFIATNGQTLFICSYDSGQYNGLLLDLFIEIAKEKTNNCFKITKQLITYLKTLKEHDLNENIKNVIKSMCLDLENTITPFDTIIPAEENLTNWNGFMQAHDIYRIVEALNVVKKITEAGEDYCRTWHIKANDKLVYLKVKEQDFDILMLSLNQQ